MLHTMLLVEDSEDDVFFFHQAKSAAGIRNPVHLLEDGRQVLDYLAGNGKFADRAKFPVPFLIFLDLKLPTCRGSKSCNGSSNTPNLKPC